MTEIIYKLGNKLWDIAMDILAKDGNILNRLIVHMCKETHTYLQTNCGRSCDNETRPNVGSFLQLVNSAARFTFKGSRRVSDWDCEWWSTMKCLSTTSSKCVKGIISSNLAILNSFDPAYLFFQVRLFSSVAGDHIFGMASPSPSMMWESMGKYSILGLEKSDFPVTVKYLGWDLSGNAATCPRQLNSIRFTGVHQFWTSRVQINAKCICLKLLNVFVSNC